MREVDTVVVGGGPAGLATSRLLSQRDREHVVLERGRIAENWRSARWDSLRVVGPNWNQNLAGSSIGELPPHEFMSRDELVVRLDDYARQYKTPIRTGVEVHRATRLESGDFEIQAANGTYRCTNLVVATGAFNTPRVPPFALTAPAHVAQLTSASYSNPRGLGDGGVLIVGSGQSGCQIADELLDHGRPVHLSVGRSWWRPRRYRGKDTIAWTVEMGRYDATVESLPGGNPAAAFAPPVQSGLDGGRDLSLHTLAAKGAVLCGRVIGLQGDTVLFGDDIQRNLERADKLAVASRVAIDAYIHDNALNSPPGDWPAMTAAYDAKAAWVQGPFSLQQHGVAAIIWAVGFRPDLQWIEVDAFHANGLPRHKRGVSEVQGLYFVGLDWQHTVRSAILSGIGEDANFVVNHLCDESRT
jgi:putative flavoprotein involved in K+ transport